MKMVPNALGTAKKMNPGAQKMKIVWDALGTAENEYGRAKYENGTRRPQ
jgi:hypothetical protein